ncbi:MAG: glycosyltransferase [Gemmatimonadota bacterium]
MRVGVVLSTYQWPQALELALWSYAAQTASGFQVIVADDGSGPDTRALVDRMRASAGLDIVHVWQPDRGFRKSSILNRAILAADRDYLVFSDGDTIAHPRLVETHARLARPGRYLAGGYVKLTRRVTEALTVEDVRAGRATSLRHLRCLGLRPGRRALRFAGPGAPGWVLDQLTPTPRRWHGNNASTWREHLVEVNGFDLDMGYGGQDAAVGDRLENLGVRPLRIRHRAPAVHMHHERPWRDPEGMSRIAEQRARIRQSGQARAPRGIAELEREEGAGVVSR